MDDFNNCTLIPPELRPLVPLDGEDLPHQILTIYIDELLIKQPT